MSQYGIGTNKNTAGEYHVVQLDVVTVIPYVSSLKRNTRIYRQQGDITHSAKIRCFQKTKMLAGQLPMSYRVLCTIQRADWLFTEVKSLTPPDDFRLPTLCRYFGIPFSAQFAHDALYDARATLALYRQIAANQPVAATYQAA